LPSFDEGAHRLEVLVPFGFTIERRFRRRRRAMRAEDAEAVYGARLMLRRRPAPEVCEIRLVIGNGREIQPLRHNLGGVDCLFVSVIRRVQRKGRPPGIVFLAGVMIEVRERIPALDQAQRAQEIAEVPGHQRDGRTRSGGADADNRGFPEVGDSSEIGD
jgi:hypothetical protein